MNDQEKLLRSIDQKLTMLLKAQHQSKHWVKVGAIQRLTGWNGQELRKYRDNGVLETRNIGNGLEYCLESIPKEYLALNSKSGLPLSGQLPHE